MNLHAHPQGMAKARLTLFSMEHSVWVSDLRVFDVLWVLVFCGFFLLALVRCFPLYYADVPKGALRFL
jgi:hypothetical protein